MYRPIETNDAESITVPDPDLFKAVSSHWPSGVAVITAADADGTTHGLTMSAVIPLSLDPMQFLISVDKRSTTLPIIRASGRFCINFLNKDQAEIGMVFASKSADKLATVKHRVSDWRLPVIEEAISNIICEVSAVHPGGDHEIVIGNVLHLAHAGGAPLVYLKRSFHALDAA